MLGRGYQQRGLKVSAFITHIRLPKERCDPASSQFAHTPVVFGYGFKADSGTAFVKVLTVLDRIRSELPVPVGVLGAVELRESVGDADTISQEGGVGRVGAPGGNSLFKPAEAGALERHVVIGVLGQQPGGVSSVSAHHIAVWPAMDGDGLLEERGVLGVNPQPTLAELLRYLPAGRRGVVRGMTDFLIRLLASQ